MILIVITSTIIINTNNNTTCCCISNSNNSRNFIRIDLDFEMTTFNQIQDAFEFKMTTHPSNWFLDMENWELVIIFHV